MKTFVYLTSAVALLALSCSDKTTSDSMITEKTPSSSSEKAAYSIGFNVGSNLKSQGMGKLEIDFIAKGFHDAMNDGEEIFTMQEMQQFIQAYQVEAKKVLEGENSEWLAENAKKEGVKVTESGLQYIVVEEGNGPKPSATDQVTVHYTGTLLDGTKFDSSVDRGEPSTFGLNQVIKGWTEGLQLMSVGAKYKFFVPSDLGYGDRGAGGVIGPGATLIFDIELLEIK